MYNFSSYTPDNLKEKSFKSDSEILIRNFKLTPSHESYNALKTIIPDE
jgi:hypothetical protein